LIGLLVATDLPTQEFPYGRCFYALLIGLLVATTRLRPRPRATTKGFYALLIGLLVATADLRSGMITVIPCFYALLIGLLVATDPATDGS